MSTADFYLKEPEPNKSCFLVLRDIIIASHSEMQETVKYGMPCFTVGKKIFCYLWKDKVTGQPYILFSDGIKMNHPSLEQGSRKKMKVLNVDPNNDLNIDLIKAVLKEALSLVA